MNFLMLLACGLAGMGIVLVTTPLILKAAAQGKFFKRAADFHHDGQTPVPRLGGLALAVAFILVQLVVAAQQDATESLTDRLVVLFSSLAMFGLGFWDDLKPLGARKKLLGQILIATFVCGFGISIQNFKIPFTDQIIPLHGWGTLLTILWLVAITNLINLVDGVDGVAGGICLMLMALLAYQCNSTVQLLAAGMVGALLGFLKFNFPPARIYLGDGGAYFLGFQIGIFSLVSSQKGSIVAALVAPMFVLGLPIVDIILAILRRGLRGLPVFRPDRRHLHHHLLEMGFSRRKVVLSIYAVTLIFMVMGFITFWSNGHWTPILLGVSALILLICAGGLRFSREWFSVGRIVGNSLAMRQDIQTALCLTRWLAMEAGRRNTPESLWQNLVFVAQRLGYTAVKLTAENRTKCWERPGIVGPLQHNRHELRDGHGGVLELWAPGTPGNESASSAGPDAKADDPFIHRLADHKVFCIMSELLAEGWANAAKNWDARQQMQEKISTTASTAGSGLTREVTALSIANADEGILSQPTLAPFKDQASGGCPKQTPPAL